MMCPNCGSGGFITVGYEEKRANYKCEICGCEWSQKRQTEADRPRLKEAKE